MVLLDHHASSDDGLPLPPSACLDALVWLSSNARGAEALARRDAERAAGDPPALPLACAAGALARVAAEDEAAAEPLLGPECAQCLQWGRLAFCVDCGALAHKCDNGVGWAACCGCAKPVCARCQAGSKEGGEEAEISAICRACISASSSS